ncbi:MAG: hypothetical protein CXR30_11680 [Geobacter sp.]|nr:MAG: hypothetical protein CXR30_11680 [Geobacter sp.]
MDETNGRHRQGKTARKILAGTLVAGLLSLVALALSLKIYLATPQAATRLARLLTAQLHQNVHVSALELTSGAIRIKGLSLDNPPGFPAGGLAGADTVVIAPQWRDLLSGRRSIRLLELQGVRVHILRDKSGTWNFSQLQRLLTAGKGGGAELFIKQFSITDGILQVNGVTAKGLALRISNLATKGSQDAGVALAFEDAGGNHYSVSGNARVGNNPAFDLALTAPALRPEGFAGLPQLKNLPWPTGGTGALRVNAALHGGLVRAGGTVAFDRITIPPMGDSLPLSGKLDIKGDYGLKTGTARLEALDLTVDRLLQARADGSGNAGHGGAYSVHIGIDGARPGALATLLPKDKGRVMVVGGKLNGSLHLTGSRAAGITGATGSARLEGGSLARGGRLFVSGLDGTITLAKAGAGFSASGRLAVRPSHGKALLEALQAQFKITLSGHLQPLAAQSNAFSARFMGVPLSGSLGFRARATTPFDLSLRIPTTSIATLATLFQSPSLQIEAGNADAELQARGRGPQEFGATARVRVSAVQGKQGNKVFALKAGTLDLILARSKGHTNASGAAHLTAMALAEKSADAAFSYRYADGVATIFNASLRSGNTQAAIAALSGRIPARETVRGTTSYPLAAKISGCDIRQGKLAVTGLATTLQGAWFSDPGGGWLEGNADLATGGVAWQGKPVAAPSAHLTFARPGTRGTIGGSLLGGVLSGTVSFQPFALAKGGDFHLQMKQARLAKAAGLLPAAGGFTLEDGLLDSDIQGDYSSRNGLECRFKLHGSEIAAKSGKKALPANGAISMAGAVSGHRLEVSDAAISVGPLVSLKAKGVVEDFRTPMSRGDFAFELPRTTLNDLVDPFVNILPRFIQEATLDGNIASSGTLKLHDGHKLLEGTLHLGKVRLEVPSQQFSAADIEGSVPFSLDLSGVTPGKEPGALSFNRENYPRLLGQFHRPSAPGQSLHVGQVNFGPMAFGALSLRVDAAGGITRITSLQASLFGGELFGKGYLAMDKGLTWRGDLLVNSLSLTQLCSAFPKINGYISGRIDGIVSLSSRGGGLRGLSGFTDLWAREGGGERMLVSKDFLQRLSGKKLSGFFFRDDRPYDQAEINALMEKGYLTFETLDITHTNIFGVRDLSVTIAPAQNRIAIDHLIDAIKQAAVRGKAAGPTPEAPVEPEFKWQE